ncbi:hypothetical protein TOPH_01179 [Tolypocladium ophioglossoides CBS 100239]|uniref:Uncharacterized protein n=1 Tax=Tolypocladium ophioglossoides (strain CBS 100239) TaxID=1163406 RepID=A0A0L0NJ37_TOLOC|nr:hypothetical protein TOPH_01179 [Tolypocladium ophioglossoides CBS 100239]
MAYVNLSTRDINVLEKIKDPESNPATGVVTDPSLSRDPHVTDTSAYERVVQRERIIIQTIQAIEKQLGESHAEDAQETAVKGYQQCISDLQGLISEHPNYASARNNRAQIMRRLYGDAMLLDIATGMPIPLIAQPEQSERRRAATTALEDMERSIALLSPATMTTPLSPQAARTLSMAYTQRAAVYLRTSKLLSDRLLDEAAARDLAYGGRYGNLIAKSLAVSVNPTAKLCGQIVREAMKKEYGLSFEA